RVSVHVQTSLPPPARCRGWREACPAETKPLMVAGYANASYSYCSETLFDDNILIVPGTKLTYWVWHVGTGKLAMDGHFTDGTDIRDLGFVDPSGKPFHPGQRNDTRGQRYNVEVDISGAAGKVLAFRLLGCANRHGGYLRHSRS